MNDSPDDHDIEEFGQSIDQVQKDVPVPTSQEDVLEKPKLQSPDKKKVHSVIDSQPVKITVHQAEEDNGCLAPKNRNEKQVSLEKRTEDLIDSEAKVEPKSKGPKSAIDKIRGIKKKLQQRNNESDFVDQTSEISLGPASAANEERKGAESDRRVKSHSSHDFSNEGRKFEEDKEEQELNEETKNSSNPEYSSADFDEQVEDYDEALAYNYCDENFDGDDDNKPSRFSGTLYEIKEDEECDETERERKYIKNEIKEIEKDIEDRWEMISNFKDRKTAEE